MLFLQFALLLNDSVVVSKATASSIAGNLIPSISAKL